MLNPFWEDHRALSTCFSVYRLISFVQHEERFQVSHFFLVRFKKNFGTERPAAPQIFVFTFVENAHRRYKPGTHKRYFPSARVVCAKDGDACAKGEFDDLRISLTLINLFRFIRFLFVSFPCWRRQRIACASYICNPVVPTMTVDVPGVLKSTTAWRSYESKNISESS